MTDLQQRVLTTSLAGIDAFLQEYQSGDNALDYIYEAEIQSELYVHIKSALKLMGLLRAPGDWTVCEYHGTHAHVSLVHCEQTIGNLGADVVVWDPECGDNAKAGFSRKRCLLVVEVKQRCTASDARNAVQEDYNKISGGWLSNGETALALAFCTDPVAKLVNGGDATKDFRLAEHVKPGAKCAVVVCRDGVWVVNEPDGVGLDLASDVPGHGQTVTQR